jgi:hypothetical protein
VDGREHLDEQLGVNFGRGDIAEFIDDSQLVRARIRVRIGSRRPSTRGVSRAFMVESTLWR